MDVKGQDLIWAHVYRRGHSSCMRIIFWVSRCSDFERMRHSMYCLYTSQPQQNPNSLQQFVATYAPSNLDNPITPGQTPISPINCWLGNLDICPAISVLASTNTQWASRHPPPSTDHDGPKPAISFHQLLTLCLLILYTPLIPLLLAKSWKPKNWNLGIALHNGPSLCFECPFSIQPPKPSALKPEILRHGAVGWCSTRAERWHLTLLLQVELCSHFTPNSPWHSLAAKHHLTIAG